MQTSILDSEKRMSSMLNERVDILETRAENLRDEMLRDIDLLSNTTDSKISKMSDDLETQIDKLNQDKINANIIVSGIMQSDNENFKEIIGNLFNFIQLSTDLDKLTIFRLSNSSKVLVKLDSKQAKKTTSSTQKEKRHY